MEHYIVRQTIIKIKVFFQICQNPPFLTTGGGGEGLFEERRLIERGAYSVFFSTLL